MSRAARRAVTSVAIAVATLLAFEGAVTAFTGRSLLRKLPVLSEALAPVNDLAWRSLTDEESRLAAARNPGPLALHPDPLVGYVLRGNADLTINGARVRSDGIGLRARPRPRPAATPVRLLVVGASVPFGLGLGDEDTIANRLEEVLEASRGPAAQPVVCRTVAISFWNHRNAVQFVLDHMADLRPDIVVYIPFANDLSDGDIVSEGGHRESLPDATSPDPWVSVRAHVNTRLWERLRGALDADTASRRQTELGPDALTSDLSPESRRRYDENAASIGRLAAATAARGGRLLLLPYLQDDHALFLLERLARTLPELETASLLAFVPKDFTLGSDPHPNAETARTLAIWIARELLDRGLVDRGAGAPLPDVPPKYGRQRALPLDAAQRATLAGRARDAARASLQPEIDFAGGRGVLQIYGGVSVDGVVGSRTLLLLAPAAASAGAAGAGEAAAPTRLQVELAPIPGRPDLYPLEVSVLVDGVPAGHVTLTGDGPARGSLPLPPRADPAAPLEVKLIAPRWVVAEFAGRKEIAAFLPLRVACEAAGG